MGGLYDGLSRILTTIPDKTYSMFRYRKTFYRLSGMEIYCKEPHLIVRPAKEDEIIDAWEFVEV